MKKLQPFDGGGVDLLLSRVSYQLIDLLRSPAAFCFGTLTALYLKMKLLGGLGANLTSSIKGNWTAAAKDMAKKVNPMVAVDQLLQTATELLGGLLSQLQTLLSAVQLILPILVGIFALFCAFFLLLFCVLIFVLFRLVFPASTRRQAAEPTGKTVRLNGFGGSSPNSMNSLLIRNSPYQAPIPTMPGASPFALNQQLGGSEAPMQQPIFSNGKYGMGPSAAVLPSEIPMDVLVGRQIGLNELSQSASSSGGRHPFPLGPFFGSDGGRGPSSVGGPFGTDFPPKGMAPQYGHGTNMMQQEFVGSLNSQPAHSTIPDMINQSPLASMPSQPFKRIIRQQNGTYAEQIQQIDALVQRMEPKRQTLYREFMHENDEREHLHRDRVHKTVGEMSENAQEQFTKISATLRNPNVPDQERWDRVLQLYGKMEPELRNEFEQKFKGFPTFGPTSH
uniref:DUF148 domain-containing protein n=2 Tax=Globodera pallida TaxID=36090 RepID=A0A183BT56_GLOPA